MTQHEQNVEKLLLKILGELRGLREDLTGQRAKEDPKPEPPKSQYGGTVSVNKAPGQPTLVNDGDTPSALTSEQREQMAAQSDPRRVAPAFKTDAVMLTPEQLRSFGIKPKAEAAKIVERRDPAPIVEPVPGRSGRP